MILTWSPISMPLPMGLSSSSPDVLPVVVWGIMISGLTTPAPNLGSAVNGGLGACTGL